MGLKRLSQAVTPVDAGNVDPNRYVYLTLENAEPSLGAPDGNGYVLYSNIDGSREFTEIGNLLIEGGGILIDANGRISIDPNVLVNVNISANVDVTRTGFTRFEYITPNGQVLLTGTDIYGQDLDFSSNDQIMVYIDGFLLQPNVDYTYANGYGNANVTSALVLELGTRENSIVSIHRISPTLFGQGPSGAASFTGTSDEVPEGANNLYFSNARARAAFSASDSIDYDQANGIFSSNIEYANGIVEAFIDNNTTTDNITEGSNLYFTNARALTAVKDNIDTSNVAEGANLYFTNTRAIGSLTAGQNITIEANGLVVADTAGTFSGNTDAIPEGVANLYFTNTRALDAVTNANISIFINDIGYLTDSDLTTSNVAEGSNLYYTDERVAAYIEGNVTTSNVAEGSNLYFTNARALSAIQDTLSTSNVAEGSNLYFTNARVEGFVSQNITTSNITEGSNLYFTNTRAVGSLTAGDNIVIEANGLIVATATLGGAIPTLYTSNIIENGDVATGNVYFTLARARAAINAGPGLDYDNTTGTIYIEDGGITTTNVAEGANLYFTNTRAIGALTAGDNIVIEANGLIVSSATFGGALPTIYASNVEEDGNTTDGSVFFTNARARAAFTFGPGLTYNPATGSLQANVRSVNGQTGIVTLTTSNVAEGSNLYFTNTRAVGSLTAGDGISIEANGLIVNSGLADEVSVSSSLANIDTMIVGNLIPSVAGLRDIGNATHPWRDIWITTNSIRLGGLKLSSEDGKLVVQDTTDPGNVKPALTTADVPEGNNTSNIYFSNARVYSSLKAGNGISATALATGNIVATYGNANVLAYVNDSVTTSNVKEGANLYFTNTRARRAFTAGTGIDPVSLATGTIAISTGAGGILSGFLNASNIIETGNTTSGNVFFTNARARGAFTAGNGISITNGVIEANVRSVNGKTGVVILQTANIIESGNTTTGNVYFSNARARSAFTAGANISAAQLANGVIAFEGLAGGGTSNFTGANILAGTGIDVSIDAGGNALITNDGVLQISTTTNESNSLTVTSSEGSYFIGLAPNVFVQRTLAANNIIANTLTVNGVSVFSGSGALLTTIPASNVIETGSPTTGNVFFSNTRARRAFTAGSGIDPANLELGVITVLQSDFDLGTANTDALPEGTSNLYFTNDRVVASISSGTGINIDSNGLISTTSAITQYFDSDTREAVDATSVGVGYGNLSYNVVNGLFTYDRVTNANIRAAFQAGPGIIYDPVTGLITADGTPGGFNGNTDIIPEGVNNLYFNESRLDGFFANVQDLDVTFNNVTINGFLATAGQGGTIELIEYCQSNVFEGNLYIGIDTGMIVETGDRLFMTPDNLQNALGNVNLSDTDNEFGRGLSNLIHQMAGPANVRTFFSSNSDSLLYDEDTGIFDISDEFEQGIIAALRSTDVQDFILANDCFSGNVVLVNDDGTIDQIKSFTVPGDITLSANDADPLTEMIGFDGKDYSRRPVAAWGSASILLTAVAFDDPVEPAGEDKGIILKAFKMDGKTAAVKGADFVLLSAGVENGDYNSTWQHNKIIFDPSSAEDELIRFYYFYRRFMSEGDPTSAAYGLASILVDPVTCAITIQKNNPFYLSKNIWFGITDLADQGVGSSDVTPQLAIDIDPFRNDRFVAVDKKNASVYIITHNQGEITNIWGANYKEIYGGIGGFGDVDTFQNNPWENIGVKFDPLTPNRIYVTFGGLEAYSGYGRANSWMVVLDLLGDNGPARYLDSRELTTRRSVIGPFFSPSTDTFYLIQTFGPDSATVSGLNLSATRSTSSQIFSGKLTGGQIVFNSDNAAVPGGGSDTNRTQVFFSPDPLLRNQLIIGKADNIVEVDLDPDTGTIQSAGTPVSAESKTKADAQLGAGEITCTMVGYNAADPTYIYGINSVQLDAQTGFNDGVYLVYGTTEYLSTNFDSRRVIGVLQQSNVAGNIVPVAMLGSTSKEHTNLRIPEDIYVDIYTGEYGNVRTSSSFKMGKAVGDGNLLLYTHKLNEREDDVIFTGVENIGRGYGSISYNPYTGKVAFTTVDSSTIRGQFSSANGISYNSITGVYEHDMQGGTGITVEANGLIIAQNLYFDSNARNALNLVEVNRNNVDPAANIGGGMTYDSSTGTFTFTPANMNYTKDFLQATNGISYDSTTGVFEHNLTAGANISITPEGVISSTLYNDLSSIISSRTSLSVVNNETATTPYGSLGFDSQNRIISFTPVTSADIRGEFSAGTSITIDNGVISAIVPVLNVNVGIDTRSLGVGTANTGVTGEIVATNDITAFYSSDERLKANVIVIDNALEKVNNIRGVTFDWNDVAQDMYPHRAIRDVGVIAQEIEKVLPEVVVDRETGYKAVRYEKIIPLLIEAIKELKIEIEELKRNR